MGMSQYLEVFIDECREHIQALNENLLQLENEPENLSIVNEIFRSAHTLKGMSATMGYEDMANLTHQMENVLMGFEWKTRGFFGFTRCYFSCNRSFGKYAFFHFSRRRWKRRYQYGNGAIKSH